MIIVYGTDWCGDCFRTRHYLNTHNIPYQFINVDKNKQADEFVRSVNRGMRSVPTIVFPDGLILVEPSTHQLALKFENK